MSQLRRHLEERDAPGTLGVILASEVPLSNEERIEIFRFKLRQFNRARMEARAINLFDQEVPNAT